MSLFVNNNVILGYGGGPTTRNFVVQSAYDDDIDILSQAAPVEALYLLSTIEKILAWKGVYRIDTYDLSSADLSFLELFKLDDNKQITINGINHLVNMKNPQVIDKLIGNDIRRPAASFEFEDATATPISTAFAVGTTNSYNFQQNETGVGLKLTMNYGSGNIIRNFNVLSASSYAEKMQTHQVKFPDTNSQTITLGAKRIYNINFGAMSWQTEAQREDDWQWIRDFCCAPTKIANIYGQTTDNIVNDFASVKFSYSKSIYGKLLALKFVAQHI